MIKPVFEMDTADTWAELDRAPMVHVAAVDAHGAPLLRTWHGVGVDGSICFHGGAHGDKLAAVGQPVVLQWERVVARVPSHFIDPERACPATTYYISGQAHGHLEQVDDLQLKARVMAALMDRFQPEGGFVPIDPADPRYRKPVESLLVMRVRPTVLTGKRKLGQNRPAQQIERVLQGLWRRGGPGDLEAITTIVQHHPGHPKPPFLRGPCETTLCPQLDRRDLDAAYGLVADAYWNRGTSKATSQGAHLGSAAWVGARDPDGQLIATARANTDGHKHATIYDVAVAPGHRGRGIGKALITHLLDHPRLRDCDNVGLVTLDAQAFYAPFGFAAFQSPNTVMLRSRKRAANPG